VQLRPDVAHFQYDLSEEADRDPALVPGLMREMLEMLGRGELRPLPVTEFEVPGDAFRFIAQARHIGKIAVPRAGAAPDAVAIDPNATYMITGGTGGVGLHFAEWLVHRGARHLLLVSRRGGAASATDTLERLRAAGAEVTTAAVDVADMQATRELLRGIPPEKPLRGILHAAGVLADRSLLQQSLEALRQVAHPKWTGAWNLHQLTVGLPLDFFVLFSSAATLLGMPGQANYSAANAMLDGLAVYRRSLGLPAVSIEWGPWAGAGMASVVDPASYGLDWITPRQGTAALENLLAGGDAVATVMPVVSWSRFATRRPAGATALFSDLVRAESRARTLPEKAAATQRGGDNPKTGFAEQLQRAAPEDRARLLAEHLRQQAIQILSLSPQAKIDEDGALHDLGLDSLMAVELRNSLQISLERPLSPTLVLDYPTLRALREALLAQMFGADDSAAASEHGADRIEDLTDSEAEALLLAELERPVDVAER
jgi:NAD(P)-dependent dehydrogenase (short-subunit alcohol dehydrogenase family)